ncbi:DUF2513 domain-containing protein [Paenibacillus sp. GCM10012307]|uniref:DUF2513 domain-containing protein n=1 Tax=Paenibacillus roseus TaxID=2798579 RepID=A0A934MTE0_9BACL|nr:DUF2513 domain-containing protein [Paenibacillus roseus]MBJ6364134.1 DUF2513 domain-containing protein [Paenibacillus roseus]
MKLNHECMRDVLITIEETFRPVDAKTTGTLHGYERLSGYSLDDVNYSIHQLRDAKLLWTNKLPATISGQDYYTVRGLTPEGHAFIDAVRKDTVWEKVKTKAAAIGLVTVNTLVEVATNKLSESV